MLWFLPWLPVSNPCCLTISSEHYFIFGLPTPVIVHNASTSLIYIFNREFLPLGCFEDRDLKQAQREQRYSYKDFIHGKTHHESPESSQELGFGKGKKGQPLKVIIRNSDPKADMILDLLVSPLALLPLLVSSDKNLGARYFRSPQQKRPGCYPVNYPCRRERTAKCTGVIHLFVQVHWGTWRRE